MQAHYKILSIIYDIVKTDPAPHTYLCTPHEIILRHADDWTTIQKHLGTLATEKLVVIKQLDKIAISITNEGITKVKALKNNFVNNNFSFSDNQHPSTFPIKE